MKHSFSAAEINRLVYGDVNSVNPLLASSKVEFDVIGLTVGSECHVKAVGSAILAMRKASLNPAVVVMVGGPVVALQPDFVARVGADATAPDAAGTSGKTWPRPAARPMPPRLRRAAASPRSRRPSRAAPTAGSSRSPPGSRRS